MIGHGLLTVLLTTSGLCARQPLLEGRPDSPVRVVIYEDLQCPDCAAFRAMMDTQILPRYGSKVAFEHRDFPLQKHAWARKAAIAAEFFAEISPELGLAYRRQTMASIKETTPDNFNQRLAAFAQSNGIEPARTVRALEDKHYGEVVEKDFQDGVARGVSKTPTVFVNGKPFVEHFSFEEISKAIDEALAEAH